MTSITQVSADIPLAKVLPLQGLEICKNLLWLSVDLSDVQRQLVGVNQRYDVLGERLQDRQAELQKTLGQVKAYLQDLQDILEFLEEREGSQSPTLSLPVEEGEAQRKLKEHMVRVNSL